MLARKRRAVLVTEDDRLLGIATIGDRQKVPPGARGRVTVREVMPPAFRLVTTSPNASLRQAAGILAQREFDQLPVVEDDHVLGVVTRADIMREFETREALAIRGSRATAETLLPGVPPRAAHRSP